MLWNAVEAAETTKESRLFRMFVVALPVELNHEQQTALLTEYIRQQFVADGMCADVALHDPDPPGHNPHAHILLTMRLLDEHGDWQYKTEKEYLCVRGDEKRGGTSVLCEVNRQIRADNALLRALKEQVQKLMDAVKQGVPVLLEGLRDAMVLIQYQLLFNDGQQASLSKRLQAIRNLTTEYKTIQVAIKDKTAQRKALLAEQDTLSPLQFIRSSQISQEVAALTEDIEELRFRKEQLLASVPDGDIKSMSRQEKDLTTSMTRLVDQHEQLSAQKEGIRADYDAELAEVATEALHDIQAERDAIRAEHRESITQRLQGTYGKHYHPELLRKAERMIATELGE